MTAAKLKIDVNLGIIDAEGSESFLLEIYRDFKAKLNTIDPITPSPRQIGESDAGKKEPARAKVTQVPDAVAPKIAKAKKVSKSTQSLVKDLILSGNSTTESLKTFYAKYDAKSNYDKNLIFAYYLQQILEIKPITLDHIFTCCRFVPNTKVPEALRQSLIDTANRKGWLDTTSTEDVKVSISGINHIEHTMAKLGDQ